MRKKIPLLYCFFFITQFAICQINFEETPTSLTNVRTGDVKLADVNNDGNLDVLIAGFTTTNGFVRFTGIYLNDGNANFTLIENPAIEDVSISSAAFADIDNDGDLDLALSGSVDNIFNHTKLYENDGTGHYTELTSQVFDSGVNKVFFSDLDNDGDVDLLLSGNYQHLYKNDGTGNFTSFYLDNFASDMGSTTTNMALSDVDNDGDTDIMIMGSANPGNVLTVRLYKNDGAANFTETPTPNLTPYNASSIDFGDIDGDGDDDLLITGSMGTSTPSLNLFKNDGTGNFTQFVTPLTPVYFGKTDFADVDNDGDLDVLVSGSDSYNTVITELYENDGAGNFMLVPCIEFENLSETAIAFGDMDNDGDLDLFINGSTNNDMGVGFAYTGFYLNTPLNTTAPTPLVNLGQGPLSLCGVNSIMLNALPNNAGDFDEITYTWLQGNAPLPNNQSSLEVDTPNTYTVTVSGIIHDCQGNPVASTLAEDTIVVAEADFTVSLGPDQEACEGDSLQLTPIITGNVDTSQATYAWTGPNGPLPDVTPTLQVDTNGTYSVEVTIENCSASASVEATFYEAPQIDLGPDQNYCSLQGVVLDATPSNTSVATTNFEWDYNNTVIPENGPMVNVMDYGPGTYTVTAYVNSSCTSSDTITITENTDLEVSLSSEDLLNIVLNYCENDPVPTHQITLVAEVTNANPEEIDFTWYKNGNEIIGEENQTYTIEYTAEGQYEDTYGVRIQKGACEAFDEAMTSILIEPYKEGCEIPKGISPNTSIGINDNLDLAFLASRSGITKLEVYNRYGRRVYQKNNYVNEWYGQDEQGNQLTTGTYYYLLELDKIDPVFGKTVKDWIYINR